MSKQLENSEQTTKTKPEEMTMNLVHILFLHGILVQLEKHGKNDTRTNNFITDLVYLFEYHIDNSEEKDLKEKMNYKPTKS